MNFRSWSEQRLCWFPSQLKISTPFLLFYWKSRQNAFTNGYILWCLGIRCGVPVEFSSTLNRIRCAWSVYSFSHSKVKKIPAFSAVLFRECAYSRALTLRANERVYVDVYGNGWFIVWKHCNESVQKIGNCERYSVFHSTSVIFCAGELKWIDYS